MRIETELVTSKAVGTAETKGFSIKADGVMFDTLLAGIYADPIRAAIREICTNAYDAAPDKPFDIHLPTWMDPEFRVRDYGEGMSHEFVMDLYSMAGHSTKRDTNDAVGGFGIGSKAPLAYVDAFSVISIHENVRSVYQVFRKEDKCPAITLADSRATNEPSGVEVSFPVKSYDTQEFERKATNVLLGFDVKPNELSTSITNDVEPYYTVNNVSFYPDATFENSSSSYRDPRVFIKMGCVIYPTDIRSNDSRTAVITYEIGSFKVQTSRDGLILDKDDEKAIAETYLEARRAYQAEIQAEIDNNSSSYEEACIYAAQNGVFEFNERHGYGYDRFYEKYFHSNVEIKNYLEIKGVKTKNNAKQIRYQKGYEERYLIYFQHSLQYEIIFIDDDVQKIPSRLRTLNEDLPYDKKIVCVRRDNINPVTLKWIEDNLSTHEIADYEPKKQPRRNVLVEYCDAFVYLSTRYSSSSEKEWRLDTTHLQNASYIIKRSNNVYYINDNEVSSYTVNSYIQELFKLGFLKDSDVIACVVTSRFNSIKKKLDCSELFEAADAYLKDNLDSIEIQPIRTTDVFGDFQQNIYRLLKIPESLQCEEIKSLREKRKRDLEDEDPVFRKIQMYHDLPQADDEDLTNLKNSVDKLCCKYGLNRFFNSFDEDEMKHYIEQVNK